MTAPIILLRDDVYGQINTDSAGYATVPTVEKTYYPLSKRENLTTPLVSVVPLTWDKTRLLRSKAYEHELPIQVGIKKLVTDPTDTDEIDTLIELVEEVMNSCVSDFISSPEKFTWLRIEALRDENGNILNHERMMIDNVFLCVFTSFYKGVK